MQIEMVYFIIFFPFIRSLNFWFSIVVYVSIVFRCAFIKPFPFSHVLLLWFSVWFYSLYTIISYKRRNEFILFLFSGCRFLSVKCFQVLYVIILRLSFQTPEQKNVTFIESSRVLIIFYDFYGTLTIKNPKRHW